MGRSRGHLTKPEDRQLLLDLVDEAYRTGCRKSEACRVLKLNPRTYQRWSKRTNQRDGRLDNCRVPENKLTQEERAKILSIANQKEYAHLSPEQIVPKLADMGIYIASESSFYRVLRQANQLKRRTDQRQPQNRHKPEALSAVKPNQVYTWDISYLKTNVSGIFFYLYMIMDIYSRKIVGWQVHTVEDNELAAELIKDVCLREDLSPDQVSLHSDNGGPMKGATMLATLQKLGIAPSFSRPRVSDDNPFSESLFKTLKYCPEYPRGGFSSLTSARQWVEKFVHWYNNDHCHSGIKFVTPSQKHSGEDFQILAARKSVYEQAKQLRPSRWSGSTRNWDPIDIVILNPEKKAA